MRITRGVFVDLAIFMMALGVLVGVAFPFFCVLVGVPQVVALRPQFFASCVLAGIVLGALNIGLARKIVGTRIRHLSEKMRHVEDILIARKRGDSSEECNAANCMLAVDSADELGDSARSFNQLVTSLSEVLQTQSELQSFSELLTASLELEALAEQALHVLTVNVNADGGAILVEWGGELHVLASVAVKGTSALAANQRILHTARSLTGQTVHFPTDISLDGVVADFRPAELTIEPIVHKHVLLGVLVLASSSGFSSTAKDKIALCLPPLAMALRNAISHSQMQQLAALDPLTGVYNRRFGDRRLREELGRAVRAQTPLSLLILDIDHFKAVNDAHGHMVGDKVLATVAQTVAGSIREGDVLIRYGGEEFLCVLPGASRHDVGLVAERIRVLVGDAVVRYGAQEVRVTVSVGTASYPSSSVADAAELIKLADEAMYAAKATGRNRVVSV